MATQEAVGTPVEGGDRGSSSALTGRHRKQKRKVGTQQLVTTQSRVNHLDLGTWQRNSGFVAEGDVIVHMLSHAWTSGGGCGSGLPSCPVCLSAQNTKLPQQDNLHNLFEQIQHEFENLSTENTKRVLV